MQAPSKPVGRRPDEERHTVAADRKDGERRIGRGAFLKGSGAFFALAALGGTGAWFTAGPGARPAAAQAGLPLPEPPSLPVSRAGGVAQARMTAAPPPRPSPGRTYKPWPTKAPSPARP